mmetsp:Transcript_87704/g.152649  ORF Transcript_87704/g.152649 Transcript_87704/m.152649 type:complete len:92 (+) Transcript_87704:1922-2197(+)
MGPECTPTATPTPTPTPVDKKCRKDRLGTTEDAMQWPGIEAGLRMPPPTASSRLMATNPMQQCRTHWTPRTRNTALCDTRTGYGSTLTQTA